MGMVSGGNAGFCYNSWFQYILSVLARISPGKNLPKMEKCGAVILEFCLKILVDSFRMVAI